MLPEYACLCEYHINSTFFLKFWHLGLIFKLFQIGEPSQWGSFGILKNVYTCFNWLSKSKQKWKYYQYLSGTDLPIRTNLEMVRIFKALNGSMNTDVSTFEVDRYKNMEVCSSLFFKLLSFFPGCSSTNASVQIEYVSCSSTRRSWLFDFQPTSSEIAEIFVKNMDSRWIILVYRTGIPGL